MRPVTAMDGWIESAERRTADDSVEIRFRKQASRSRSGSSWRQVTARPGRATSSRRWRTSRLATAGPAMDDVRLDWTTSHVVSWLERPCALFRFTVNARVGRIVQPIRIHVAQARNGSIATETLLLPRPQTLAQTPLGADAAAVADEQHADGQLEIDRRPADCAVEWLELPADVAQLDEAVDRA